MRTAYSYFRLAVGSAMALTGVSLMWHSHTSTLGILLGAVGITVALTETAYVFSQFVAAEIRKSS